MEETSPDAFWRQVEHYRRVGRSGRARLVEELCDGGREALAAGVRRRHPSYDEGRVRREVVRILYEVWPALR